ncbi:MAG: DeoR/GlpR family DNA-binding transcription regulator [Clostridia bacterium]|nr:DeoR/GlpR family DNA-binding transcription regulator [Clostridia bacterium]
MNERRRFIKDYIQRKQEVGLNELKELVPDVSEMTLRRDIKALEQEGSIIRIHGGAKSINSINMLVEDVFSKRSGANNDKKQEIGEKAATYIEAENSIYLDSGSTIMALAQRIPDKRVLISTSGLNIALELLRLQNSTVNIIGGEFDKNSISMAGPQAVKNIWNLNIDTAFIGASAFSKDCGFSCGSAYHSEIKSLVLKKAKRRIVLMDSSKIGNALPYTFAWPEDIDIVITDSDLPDEIRQFLLDKGIQVI